MIRKIGYIILLTVLSTTVFGQTDDVEYVQDGDDYVLTADSLTLKDKMHYSFGMGVGFGKSSGYGDYFSTYYKTMVSYDVSPRFSINTGLMYVNSTVTNVPIVSDYRYQFFSGNISQYYAFVGGEYKLTDRLSVGGSIFYDFTSYSNFDGTPLKMNSNLDNLGYSAYVKYKVAKNLTFEAEIRMNDKNPYQQASSSFMNGFFIGRDNSFIRQR